jgi:hypothetical protein
MVASSPTPVAVEARCEAKTGYVPGEFRMEPVRCDQTRGLRSFVDGQGTTHWFCPAVGHMEAVALRNGAAYLTKPAMRPGPASAGCESGGRDGCTCDVCW